MKERNFDAIHCNMFEPAHAAECNCQSVACTAQDDVTTAAGFAVSGAVAQIKVTGLPANTVAWRASVEIYRARST